MYGSASFIVSRCIVLVYWSGPWIYYFMMDEWVGAAVGWEASERGWREKVRDRGRGEGGEEGRRGEGEEKGRREKGERKVGEEGRRRGRGVRREGRRGGNGKDITE